MKTFKTYVAGPMTGLPGFNFPAFHAAAALLRARGHEVVSPAEINHDTCVSWQQCMRTDIQALVMCDAIYLLDGWKLSKGATLEHHIADRLGLEIHFEPKSQSCLWDLTDDENMVFESACGEAWSFTDGGPKENNVKFCHGCGKPVAVMDRTEA